MGHENQVVTFIKRTKPILIALGIIAIVLIVFSLIPNQTPMEIKSQQEISDETNPLDNVVVENQANKNSEKVTHTVQIDDYVFIPQTLRVKRGDTVVWKNVGNQKNSVYSIDGSRELDSKILSGGESYEQTFEKKGKYRYISVIHTSTWGIVIVE